MLRVLQLVCTDHNVDDTSVELQTYVGKIRGSETVFLNKRVRSFLSVPFAEPPVGDNRFRPPKPKQPWTETLDATRLAPACYQVLCFLALM